MKLKKHLNYIVSQVNFLFKSITENIYVLFFTLNIFVCFIYFLHSCNCECNKNKITFESLQTTSRKVYLVLECFSENETIINIQIYIKMFKKS